MTQKELYYWVIPLLFSDSLDGWTLLNSSFRLSPFGNRILFLGLIGDCHLTEWSEWSSCELTCIDGRSFETTGRQSRSRAFIIQSLQNQESCPEQVIETRPCSGIEVTALCFTLFDENVYAFYSNVWITCY